MNSRLVADLSAWIQKRVTLASKRLGVSIRGTTATVEIAKREAPSDTVDNVAREDHPRPSAPHSRWRPVLRWIQRNGVAVAAFGVSLTALHYQFFYVRESLTASLVRLDADVITFAIVNPGNRQAALLEARILQYHAIDCFPIRPVSAVAPVTTISGVPQVLKPSDIHFVTVDLAPLSKPTPSEVLFFNSSARTEGKYVPIVQSTDPASKEHGPLRAAYLGVQFRSMNASGKVRVWEHGLARLLVGRLRNNTFGIRQRETKADISNAQLLEGRPAEEPILVSPDPCK